MASALRLRIVEILMVRFRILKHLVMVMVNKTVYYTTDMVHADPTPHPTWM